MLHICRRGTTPVHCRVAGFAFSQASKCPDAPDANWCGDITAPRQAHLPICPSLPAGPQKEPDAIEFCFLLRSPPAAGCNCKAAAFPSFHFDSSSNLRFLNSPVNLSPVSILAPTGPLSPWTWTPPSPPSPRSPSSPAPSNTVGARLRRTATALSIVSLPAH